MRRFAGALLGLGLLLGPPRYAAAQSASEIAAAKQWFTEGLALEDKAQYAEALERFRRAAAVKKTPQILFHVGICELKTGALVEAIVSLERAVESAKADGNAQVESAARSELDALRPRVPVLEIVVKGDTKPGNLTLDGKPLSGAALEAPIPVNPGQHELVAEFAGGKVKRAFKASESAKSRVELEAPAATAAPVPAAAPEPKTPPAASEPTAPPPPVADSAAGSSTLPWLVIGGGVLVTAGGFYLWKLRGDQIDALDAICPEPEACPADREAEVDDLEGKGNTYTTLGIAFWGVGAAAIATGGYLLLSGSGSEKATTARVAPAFAPGVAGAVVSGRF